MKPICKGCTGKGIYFTHCKVSGATIGKQCKECDATGFAKRIYYGIVLSHKNHGEGGVWLHPTLFDTLGEAQRFKHREYFVIKTIEVRV